MKKVKIRIVKAPTMAYGGQSGWGIDLNSHRTYVEGTDGPQDSVGKTLGPVDREAATYEAERGEVIVGDMDRDGRQEMMTFGGKPHSQGGTPSNKEGFIFSKTKGMALRGPIVEKFGKKAGTKYTPADLAKQYDLTKYKAVLDDPNADELSKKTAQMMYENYESKLADLAMVQESMKGFPQGVPEIAAAKYGQQPMGTEVPAGPMAAYGGSYYMQKAGQTPKRQPVYDMDELQLLNGLRENKYTVNMPINGMDPNVDRFTLPELQTSRNKRRVYGDEDWTDQGHMADFMKRQSWFTDNATNWDPTIPGATLAFQQAYDAERSKLGLKPYFGKGQKFQAKDDKFGEYTYSAPGLYKQQDQATPVTTKQEVQTSSVPEKKEDKITLEEYQMQKGTDPRFSRPGGRRLPYNRFDVANLLTAAATPVKSYAPRMFQPDVQEMQGYFDQPDYNPLLSAANTRMQMNNTFGNIGAAMAANTYNPELSQGLIQETQRARANNLQTANNLSQANTQIRNQANMMNAQLQQDNYDKWVKTQEETDIANKLKWRKDVMPAAQNMVNNRINMEKYNALYPQYEVTGNDWRINFDGGKNYGDRAASTGANYGLKEFFAENPDLKSIYERGDDAKKLEIAKMVAARQREYRSMMGRSPKNISGNMNNPYLTAMMGMPAMGPSGAAGDEYDYGY